MNKIEFFFSEYKNTITIILGLVIIIGFFIAADSYIGDKIEEKITDETYINKLARVLRPFAIFNEQGIVTYDHGAERYIQNIAVNKTQGGDFESVTITTNVFLQTPPILSYIDVTNYAYSHERIGTYKWIFKFIYPAIRWGSSSESKKVEPIFIIEITK
ncbi:MAG: hypothetical protein KQI78_14530 [Deltaproteobacteria bacterium]|nr:hypothetical protein [Deltaproteobacteria bacterium]